MSAFIKRARSTNCAIPTLKSTYEQNNDQNAKDDDGFAFVGYVHITSVPSIMILPRVNNDQKAKGDDGFAFLFLAYFGTVSSILIVECKILSS
jgi:hypothetical protein